MAIISCPECSNSVSDRAPTCPQCGVVIYSGPALAASTPRVTTELTSKNLKGQIVISAVLFWGGLFGSILGASDGSDPPVLASFAMVIGLLWYIITKINIWWNHK